MRAVHARTVGEDTANGRAAYLVAGYSMHSPPTLSYASGRIHISRLGKSSHGQDHWPRGRVGSTGERLSGGLASPPPPPSPRSPPSPPAASLIRGFKP